ncbi:MAG TPA: hypothetical protein VNV41_17105 [Candidatus Acidoferrales bacterium]|nr:hypothetical protein [Candidatus Acidoferrales bacterium]
MIHFDIRVDVDRITLEKLSAEEWALLKSLIDKIGGDADIPTIKDVDNETLRGINIDACPLSTRARNAFSGKTIGDLLDVVENEPRN